MDISTAADELYGLAPERFTARRAELAAEAREAGDATGRAEIMALRKPTVAAWAVNLVVREHEDQVQELLHIAEELRAAQRGLAADRMRELSDRRRGAVTALTRAARDTAKAAGRQVPDAALREVQASFDAAVADENAERALRTGRLTSALSYSGFGEVDISDAVAALDARPRLAVVSAPGPAKRVPQDSARERVTQRRERAAAQARADLTDATRRRDELLTEAEQLRRRLGDIERDLKPAEAAVRAATRRLDAASR
ncbi:MAG TPA: hypothetical protein VGN35_07785 [Jatrophihabitantaceae bacterium]|jgi:hypothetical protein|nr:hypothetical protein [Jatrophihabitantaceae bacterium]